MARDRHWAMCEEAGKTDDVSLMAEAISIASGPNPPNPLKSTLEDCLLSALKHQSPRVLTYLLDDQGVDVNTVHPGLIGDYLGERKPSIELLEILIARGWDIDRGGRQRERFRTDPPLLWRVVPYHDLVEWCLDHGASVYVPGDTPPRDARGIGPVSRRPLLESAAVSGSVETFELLRSRGAPLTGRTLHQAVQYAAYNAPPQGSEPSAYYTQRMGMVRYLVDVVGIDVNAVESWPGEVGGTPLCYVAYRPYQGDIRELVWFLLDRGADLNYTGNLPGRHDFHSALEWGRDNNPAFMKAVEEWQARQRTDGAT